MNLFPRPNRNVSEMTWVTAPISGAKWQVHREVAPLLAHVVSTAEQRGYLFDYGPGDVDDDWGYYVRKIEGSGTWSWHSAGVAVDIDAQEYPQGQRRKAPPDWLIELFRQWGWDWGGRWSRPDTMHFEAPDRDRVAGLRATLYAAGLGGGAIPVPVGTPSPIVAPVSVPSTVSSEEDDMIVRNTEDGAIWAVSATHMHHMTPEQWKQRSGVEPVAVKDMHPLEVWSLALAGRQVI